ncbi:hypothetical protein BG006_007912 [Podila minutissima]|uniref:FBD domain-containing protein n=1 Tax=Podila minutissima TaxID=64525 RepID=A0A9P5SKH2_9FUNG|nr:hypothetical protein BG006_007912 [Podila minutissima]
MWPTLPWKVEEASSAVEAFMKAVARVGKHGELIEIPHDNDGAKSFSTVPTRGYGMGLESVCVVFEDNDSDFRLLWSLRHLPNLRKLEIQGQWVNRIVRDKVVFWLEDLVILLERCVRIEEVVLSNLQLVSGALNAGDRYCGDTRARRGRHFETLLEAPLESSSSALPKTSSSSSLKSLALFIFPRRIDVYLILLDTVGPALQGLDLYFVEWNCHLPESTENMLSLLSACPVLRTLTIRLKPNFARESTALQNMPRFTNMQHLSILEGRSKLHDCHHGQHDPPATRPCLDFAELATVFPLTLTALTLTGVQIELTNLLHVDPKHVQGVMQLRVLYRRSCVCPVEVLERVLSVWRGLVTLEMGALYGEDHHSNMSSNANYLNFEEQQQQQQQGETGTSSRDRRLVEAMRGSNWACRYTLRQLDLCQMDVHLYPGYCELLLGRIRELVGLRDLRVDMRCFRVRQSKMKKVEGTGTGTGTGTFITSAAGGQATGDVEEVDLSLRPKFEWRQLDRLFVHGERYVSGSWGFGATVEWFEPLRVDEMRWIQEEVLSPQCKFLYCHFGEWREMKNETEQ